jgi:hypothetical protein
VRATLVSSDRSAKFEIHAGEPANGLCTARLNAHDLSATLQVYLADTEIRLSEYLERRLLAAPGLSDDKWISAERELAVTCFAVPALSADPGMLGPHVLSVELTSQGEKGIWQCTAAVSPSRHELRRFIHELAALEQRGALGAS